MTACRFFCLIAGVLLLATAFKWVHNIVMKPLIRFPRRSHPLASLPYSMRPQEWFQLRVGTKALATFMTVAGGSQVLRQCFVELDLPLMMKARSLAACQSLLPELLSGFSSAQLMLCADIFGRSKPVYYLQLVELEIADPSSLWVVESELVKQ